MRRLAGMTSSVWFPYFSSFIFHVFCSLLVPTLFLMHLLFDLLPRIFLQLSESVSETYDSIKEGLRRSFAEKANEFSLLLDTISLSITKFEGVLEVPLPLPLPFSLLFLLSPKESIDIDPRINLNRSARLKRVWRLSKLSWAI